MDPSRVLVALEEQVKWRERRARLLSRLEDVRRRKRFAQRELAAARQRLGELSDAVFPIANPPPARDLRLGTLDNVR